MKLVLASIALVLSLAPLSNGASIVWGAAVDNGFSLASGANLPAGSLVRLGTFDIDDTAIAAAAIAGNIGFLNSHFTEAANSRIGASVGGIDEHFSQTSEVNTGPGGLNIVGDQLYIWAFASQDNTSVGSSINTAFQLGIYYLNDASWLAPQNDDFLFDIDMTNLTAGNVLDADAKLVVGTFPTGTSDLPGNAPNFGLSIVPEPSVATAVIASVGLLALRRRRRS